MLSHMPVRSFYGGVIRFGGLVGCMIGLCTVQYVRW